MTEEQRVHLKEIHQRMQEGYRIMDDLRLKALKDLDTVNAVESLRTAFEMAQKLTPRNGSGLEEFYAALAKVR